MYMYIHVEGARRRHGPLAGPAARARAALA